MDSAVGAALRLWNGLFAAVLLPARPLGETAQLVLASALAGAVAAVVFLRLCGPSSTAQALRVA